MDDANTLRENDSRTRQLALNARSSLRERRINSASRISRAAASFTLLFLLLTLNAYAQVAIDSTSTAVRGSLGNGGTLTISHTSTGANLVLVVGVSMNISGVGNANAAVSSVTYSGAAPCPTVSRALTRAGAHNDSTNARRTEIWYLIAPQASTCNITVTVATGGFAPVGTVADATTFTGADQTTPIRTYASNDSAGTNSDNTWVDVISGPDDYVLDTLAASNGVTATPANTAVQTAQWGLNSAGGTAATRVYGFGSTRAGSASVAMSENLSANASWSVSAVSIQPVQADLRVTSSGSSSQFPANVTYVVTVTNNGPDIATAVSLTNTLAPGLTLVSATPAGGVGGSCTGVNCTWTSIATSATVTITATPSAPGGYPLSSSATSGSTDLNSANDSATTVSYSEFDQCFSGAGAAGNTISGVINTYYPGAATVNAGSTALTLGTPTGGHTLAGGDLVLIIQMQDAAINTSNNSQYGDGISGAGSSNLNGSGVYEFATVVSYTAGTGALTVQAAGPGGGLLYTYTHAGASAAQGARNFQVVWVPNYSSATLSNTTNLTATPWNGSIGGVLALNVTGTLTLNGATVDVSGQGFRGAAGLKQVGAALVGGEPANTDYLFTAPAAYNTTTLTAVAGADGSKGEGIAGTPRWIEDVTTSAAGVVTAGTVASTGQAFAEGYPLGSMARGAPGNAGGGGTDADPACPAANPACAGANDQNSGGGGGANGGAGGQGGDSWNTNLAIGGVGGGPFPGGVSRLVMGGGGGAGTSNNNSNFSSSSGAPGGGIVMIRAATITGNVTIDANGFGAYNNTPNDGGGGGGAGGSIAFLWGTVTGGTSTVTLNANGGRGGDAWDSNNGGTQNGLNADRHGPGGGGGGGVILYTGGAASAVTATSNGGAPGVTLNTTGLNYGASAGIVGTTTGGVSLVSSPGPHFNAACADLSIAKSGAPSPVLVNNALTYTITVRNNGASNASNITITDVIPAQVTYISSSVSGGSGGSCPAPSGGVLTCTLTALNSGATATITVNTTASTAYSEAVNTAIVDSSGTPDPNPTNNTATASIAIEGPTSVHLNSFIAQQNGSAVVISWKSGGELHNLGFNVYRESAGERVQLNPSLISGSALMMREGLERHGAKRYAWIDRSPRPGALYWLEDVDLNGTRTMHGPISAQGRLGVSSQAVTQARTISDFAHTSSSRMPGAQTGIASQRESHMREFIAHPEPFANRRNVGFQLASQPAVKILVGHEGWYRVTQPQLAAAGLRSNVDSRSLHLFAEGIEQPIRITGPGAEFGPQSAMEFYGTAIDTPYSGQRVYWLTVSNGPGLRITDAGPGGSAGPLEQSFIQTVELKPRTTYFAALLHENTDNFFGPLISPTSAVLNLDIANAAPGQGSMEVVLQGVTDNQDHDITVTLNGATLGDLSFEGQNEGRATFEIPAGVLADGANTITFTAQQGTNDLSLVDYVDVSFPQTLTAESDLLKFTADEGESVEVNGFIQPPARLVDITNPQRPVLVNFRTSAGNGGYTLSATVPWVSRGKHTFLALANDQLANPVSYAVHQPSALHDVQRGAEDVIVTYPDFVGQVQPLAALRQAEGRSVALLDVNQVYDEFNFGERSPYAIKEFLRTAAHAWKNKPRYLLLAGGASVDPRNYLGFGFLDFVPTKIVVTSELKTASDDWFSDFDNTGFAQIATGRLPGRTSSDMQTMVTKIVNYASGAVGSWTNQAVMVADVDDPTLSFSQGLISIQKLLPSTMNVTDVFAGVLGPSVARQNLLAAIQSGELLVNYSGHGSVEIWSGDDLFDDAAAASLTNGSKLPVFVIMNCLNGFFHDVYTEGLATALMLAQNGGAVAVWASSGLTAPDPQFQMNQALVQTLFSQPSLTLGDAVLSAKSGVADEDVRKTFILFGDPLMVLKRQ
ncbi:MAG TPA: C25 family cysteine peptidase [Terriglobales bacterium]|nr:C25 family cysteine peptidase [Terriglobales bacterium]